MMSLIQDFYENLIKLSLLINKDYYFLKDFSRMNKSFFSDKIQYKFESDGTVICIIMYL